MTQEACRQRAWRRAANGPRIGVVLALILALGAMGAGAARGAMVWAVGDGSSSASTDDDVAGLISSQGIDHLLYLGDVYENGTAQEFATYYAGSFGRFK